MIYTYSCFKSDHDDKYLECIIKSEENQKTQKSYIYEMGTLLFIIVYLIPLFVQKSSYAEFKNQLDSLNLENLLKNFILSYRDKINDDLLSYYNFIQLCLKDHKYCTFPNLANFTNMLSHPLKRGYLLIPFESNSDVILNENIIKNKLDILNDSTVSTSILEFEQKLPKQVNFYPLSSIEDLFSASLQEIFNANLKIKKCEYCDYMFIPYEKRADIKYCEKIWEENNGKTCGQLAKLENQRLKYQDNKAERKIKSVRTNISRRANKAYTQSEYEALHNELKPFICNANLMRNLAKYKKYTEDDVIEWADNYWKNVKVTAKMRKNEAKSH